MTIYAAIAENKRKTWLLILSFLLVSSASVGAFFSWWSGVSDISYFLGGLFLSTIVAAGAYWKADQVVLRLNNAHPISKKEEPRLYRIVENLCLGAGLPRPEIYVIESQALNALATGRDPAHAKVAITRGLLEKLDDLELEGVMAHELSHIKNYDIRLMTMVVVLVGFVLILSDFFWRSSASGSSRRKRDNLFGALSLILIILAPLIAQLLKFALSRQREYLADSAAALLTRYPEGLARALEKIAATEQPPLSVNPATVHLFIVNPLAQQGGISSRLMELFSTHPPVEERIKRLRSM